MCRRSGHFRREQRIPSWRGSWGEHLYNKYGWWVGQRTAEQHRERAVESQPPPPLLSHIMPTSELKGLMRVVVNWPEVGEGKRQAGEGRAGEEPCQSSIGPSSWVTEKIEKKERSGHGDKRKKEEKGRELSGWPHGNFHVVYLKWF